MFAQRRQLGALAVYIPTKDPRLRGTAYRMVLDALMLQPSDHPRLLALLHAWPSDLFSLPALTEAVVARQVPGLLPRMLGGQGDLGMPAS